jgi:hypothetical protein
VNVLLARPYRLTVEPLEDRTVPTADVLYAGNIDVNNTSQNEIVRFDAGTGDYLGRLAQGPAGQFKTPSGIIPHQGGVLVANQRATKAGTDVESGQIVWVDPASGTRTVVVAGRDAGNPNAPWAPRGMVLAGGVLYVADQEEQEAGGRAPEGRVRMYDAAHGWAYLGSLRPPTGVIPAEDFHPRGVVVGPDGWLYVTSIVVDDAGEIDPTTAGYVTAYRPGSGEWKLVAANDGDGVAEPGETADLHRPEGIVFGPDGRLFVNSFRADAADTDKVLVFTRAGDGFTQTGQIDLAAPTAAGGKRAFAQAMVFGPDRTGDGVADLYVPITGGSPATSGVIRVYDVATLGMGVGDAAPEPFQRFGDASRLKGGFYLAFGYTNPASLAYEPPGERLTAYAPSPNPRTGGPSQATGAGIAWPGAAHLDATPGEVVLTGVSLAPPGGSEFVPARPGLGAFGEGDDSLIPLRRRTAL